MRRKINIEECENAERVASDVALNKGGFAGVTKIREKEEVDNASLALSAMHPTTMWWHGRTI